MATDGVKIIDGDLAHDTYTTIVGKYEEGTDFELIRKAVLSDKELLDEFDYEILITSYALGLWEIGQLDLDTMTEVRKVISIGACVKKWEEWDARLGKQRAKVLERFLLKISTPKKNPIKVKKFRPVQNPFFNEGELLAFRYNEYYYATIVSRIQLIRNYCIYTFGITDCKSELLPSAEEVMKSNILITKVGSWESEESINERQPGLKEHFGSLKHQEFEGTVFFAGLVAIDIEHKKLKKFKEGFNKIGQVNLIEGFKYKSAGSYNESLEETTSSFINYLDHCNEFKIHKLPIRNIIKKP